MRPIDFARFLTFAAGIVCLLATLTGCILDRWAPVEPGTYTVVRSAGQASQMAAREIRKLEIDREARVAVLTPADGSEIIRAFVPQDRSDWPDGCPSNINDTRMEVLDLGGEPLTIGSLTFPDPLIVRDCPPTPEHVVLRAGAGQIGGSGTACAGTEECITFAPGEPTPPSPDPSGAMKGYELYSWPADGEWRVSLLTGTDRVKTYAEVTGRESAPDALLTGGTVGDLLTVLDALPADVQIVWRGAGALEQIGIEPHNLALPPQTIINDVVEHANETGADLIIVR
jgi:hypothetical protein